VESIGRCLTAFAADKHKNQRRKDAEASPYINHPIALATPQNTPEYDFSFRLPQAYGCELMARFFLQLRLIGFSEYSLEYLHLECRHKRLQDVDQIRPPYRLWGQIGLFES